MPATVAESCSEGPRPWRRGLLWLVFLGPFFFLTYGFANDIAAQRSDVPSIVFDWEHSLPFLAWTILPYWLIDLFYGLSFLLPRSRAEVDAHGKRLLLAQVVSVGCFLLWPLRFSFERPETEGFFGALFDVLLGFDKPFNQAPSLHISLLVILWSLGAHHLRGLWRWPLHIIALLIAVSVLTTYQHHFIDIPTGLLLGGVCVLLFPLRPAPAPRQTDTRRWRFAGYYLLGAGLFLLPAWAWGGAWLWMLWPAAALLLVTGNYACGTPRGFGKQGAGMQPIARLIYAPYLLAAWLNVRYWTRGQRAASEILPGLYLARLPTARELQAMGVEALVDCCAELPVNAGQCTVHAVPMLDLLVPEADQLDAGVVALDAACQQGRTLVFCALGYSRSALLVAAWLLHSGRAQTLPQALQMLRETRPQVVLSAAHLRQLETWHAHRARP